MPNQLAPVDATEAWLRDLVPLLFLADVTLMFAGMFFANAAAWWIWLPFHLLACSFTVFVLYLAVGASRYVAQTIPGQRPIGIGLYVSCHVIQFLLPGQVPLALAGYLMMAAPLSMLFLFDHLQCEQWDETARRPHDTMQDMDQI